MLYKRYLRRQPELQAYEVLEAASGEESLALFAQHQPDCVLLDYNLLDTDGLTLLGELKRIAPPDTLCVVMITGGGSEQLAVRALNNGALDYLVKGHFDQELLAKTVLHAIEKNEWRQHEAEHRRQLQAVNQQLRESLAELTETRRQLQQSNDQLTSANAAIQARNQALGVANQQLARTNADLDNFVYAASHDLRQPVNNLCGLFDELRRSVTFPDPAETVVLQLAEDSLRDLSNTIDGLTAAVQEQRQPGEHAAELVELAELTGEVLQVIRPQVQASQASICTDFAELPALLYVRSNLRTILHNLLSNALKYRHAERQPRIALRTQVVAGQPVLEISDNGLGMNLERHGAELFQLFRRFHPQASDGTGVGLFLVNRLVQSHGGRIEVESEEGIGTTFRLYLRG